MCCWQLRDIFRLEGEDVRFGRARSVIASATNTAKGTLAADTAICDNTFIYTWHFMVFGATQAIIEDAVHELYV
jgi:hypothetical protein